MRRLRFLIPLLVAAPLAFAGCKQADGDRCQTNDDCSSGLCVLPPGGSSLTGGTCQSSSTDLSATPDDSGTPPDFTVPLDQLPPPDLLPVG